MSSLTLPLKYKPFLCIPAWPSSPSDSDSPFLTFVNLFDRTAVKPQDLSYRVGKVYLEVSERLWIQERRFVLDLFNQVRRIFEFITNNEHTVWFVLPERQVKDPTRPMVRGLLPTTPIL